MTSDHDMHGSTCLAFSISEGIFFAADTRKFNEKLVVETHEWNDKFLALNGNVHVILAGRVSNVKDLKAHLNQDHLGAHEFELPSSIASKVLKFVQIPSTVKKDGQIVEKEVAALIVGFENEEQKIYHVDIIEKVISDVMADDGYKAIGSGSTRAGPLLASRYPRIRNCEQGRELAFCALTYAALNDRKTGNWLTVKFLPMHGVLESCTQSALQSFRKRFDDIDRGQNALYLLIPDGCRRADSTILNIFWRRTIKNFHCLGLIGEDIEEDAGIEVNWPSSFHFHRIEFKGENDAGESYMQALNPNKNVVDVFEDAPVTWITVDGHEAMMCVESREMLDVILTHPPLSWDAAFQ